MKNLLLIFVFLILSFSGEAQKAVLVQSFKSGSTYNTFKFAEDNFYIDNGTMLEGFNVKKKNIFFTAQFGGKIASPVQSVREKVIFKGYNSFESVFSSDSVGTTKIVDSINNSDLKIYSGNEFSIIFDDNVIYATDGTKAGTEEILSGEVFKWWFGDAIYIPSENKFYITISTESENKVYSTDGTKEGTDLLAVYSLGQKRHSFIFTPDSSLYLAQHTPDSVKIYEIIQENGHLNLKKAFRFKSSIDNQISITNGRIVFFGPDPDKPFTTSRLLHAVEDDSVYILSTLKDPSKFLGYYNNDAVFYSNVEANKSTLFTTNGTREGTKIIHRDVETGNVIQYEGDLYFLGKNDEHGSEVWRYDGKEASLLMDLEEGAIGLKDLTFHIYNKELYFAARLTRDLTLLNVYLLSETANKISVSTYADYNQNNIRDDDEPEMPYQHFLFQPDGVHFYTTQNKEFISLFNGRHDLSLISKPGWQVPSDLSSVLINLPSDDRNHYSFGIFPDSIYTSIETKLMSGSTRCSSYSTFIVHYKNIGTTRASGKVAFKPDDKYKIISTDPVVEGGLNDGLNWPIGVLDPQQAGIIKIVVENPTFESMGDNLTSNVITNFLEPNSNTSFDDTVKFSVVATCSYDPNDIQVTPMGLGEKHLTLKNQELDYLIRFQNTGNDTAYTVVVESELMEQYDTNSLKIIGSSHKMTATLIDNLLRFNFGNIMLPDSLADEPGSHGYVLYSISPKPFLKDSTVVSNKADIYFDHNPAIVTNVVFNTLVDKFPESTSKVLGIDLKHSNKISVYPNPARSQIHIEKTNIQNKTVNYQILTSKGQIVLSTSYTNTILDTLNVSNLPPGVYFLRVKWNDSSEIHRIIILK